MLHAGLTGGVGSGKSLAAAEFARLGAVVFDADEIARELLSKNGDGYRKAVEAFGASILGPDMELDRKALADLVFKKPESRRKLDSIIHPMIVSRRRRLLEEVKLRAPGSVVVTEAALIFEAGTRGEFDCVVLVVAPEAARRERLAARGWSGAEIESRMRSQWPDERKRPLADYVIENGGGPEDLKSEVARTWSALVEKSKRG